jgi:hypothetical protein
MVVGGAYFLILFLIEHEYPNSQNWWTLASFGWKVASVVLIWTFIFRILFEKWLWRMKVFQGSLVTVPDLSGVWSGTLESISFNKCHRNVVEIDHRFDRVLYRTSREREDGTRISSEHTIECEVRRDERSDDVLLVVVYSNEPGLASSRAEHGYPHNGCALLRLRNEKCARDQWKMEGVYWTNKPWPMSDKPLGGTRGEISLQWMATSDFFHQSTQLQKELYALTRP